jgi:hypothetical protein
MDQSRFFRLKVLHVASDNRYLRVELNTKGTPMHRRYVTHTALALIAIFACNLSVATGSHPAFAESCGKSTMVIRCASGTSTCEKNELVFRQGTNSPMIVPSPKGLEEYDPVGLACVRTPTRVPYFIVEYGDASNTCASCEWHHIISEQGKLLTQSDPAFTPDESSHGGNKSEPNTEDFIRVSRKLKLSKPEITYGH